MTSDTIICAVAEHGSPAAVAVAAREATRLGAQLHLVHVSPLPESERVDQVLDEAVRQVLAAHPDLEPVRHVVDRTWIAAGLAAAGRGARYLVVERTHRQRLHRFLSGSTDADAAFQVTAPVLSVPRGWQPDRAGPALVTVAVQDGPDVGRLVRLAADEAATRGADLVVLHVADRAHGYDEASVDTPTDWVDRAHLLLDPLIRDATREHPDLKVRLDVVLDRPADALVRASAASTLLVAGRRRHEHAWGTHLGPVVRRVLLDAACPVLLPPDDARWREPRATRTTTPGSAGRPGPEHGPSTGAVVVAIGEDDAAGAVRFAVAEAIARATSVHVVHVVLMPSVDGLSPAEVWREALAQGRRLLARATDQARTAAGDRVPVTHRLLSHGALLPNLLTEAEHAEVVVVQHRRLSRAHRLLTRSVTSGLAARADVPVIAVPDRWSAGPERIGCVVVGVQDDEDLKHLLPIALHEGRRRGLPVRVVHADRVSAYERAYLSSSIDSVRQAWPDVPVHHVIEDEDPVDLLVGAMTAAELVVVGRRHHGLARRSHLGPVARRVLEESTFPVLLAPPEGAVSCPT